MWSYYLSMILFLLCYYLMVYFSMEYANEIYTEWRVISKSVCMRQVQFFINVGLFTLTILCSMRSAQKAAKINIRFAKVDEKLKFLNVSLDGRTSTYEAVLHMCAACLVSSSMAIIEYKSFQSASRTNLYVLMSITNQLPQLVNCFAIVPFVLGCLKVSRRNQAINDLISTMTNPEKNHDSSLPINMNNGETLCVKNHLKLNHPRSMRP